MLDIILQLVMEKSNRKTVLYLVSILFLILVALTAVYSSLFYSLSGLNPDSVSYVKIFLKSLNYLIDSPSLVLGTIVLILAILHFHIQGVELSQKEIGNKKIVNTLLYYIFLGIYFYRFSIEWTYWLSPIALGASFYNNEILNELSAKNEHKQKRLIFILLLNLVLISSLVYGFYYVGQDTDNFLFLLCVVFISLIQSIDFTKFSSKSAFGGSIVLIFWFGTGVTLIEKDITRSICKDIKFGAFVVGNEVFYGWTIYQDNNFIWLKSWEQDPIFPNLYKINVSAITYIDDYSVSGKINDYELRFSSCQN